MKKRFFAALLSFIMIFSLLPTSALAKPNKAHKISVNIYKVVLDSSKPLGYQTPVQIGTKIVTCKDNTGHSGYNHSVELKEFYPTNVGASTTDWSGWEFDSYYTKGKEQAAFYSWTSSRVNATANVTGSEPYPCSKNFYLIYKDTTPTAPTKPDDNTVKTLLGDVVTVDCINTSVDHADRTYPLLDGSFSVGDVQGSAGSYTCAVTVNAAKYVNEYNKSISGHSLSTADTASKTITLKYNSTSKTWAASSATPIVFKVECKTPEPPKAPDAPNYDDLKTLIGDITVNCTNDKATHAPKTKGYSLISGSYTTDGVKGDAESGYTYTVTINSQKYVEAFDGETGAAHDPKNGTATVTLEYKNDAWSVKSGTPVSFDVECVTEVTPPEKPGAEDLAKLEAPVKVECTTKTEHGSISYALADGDYRIGDVTPDGNGGYTCTITVTADKYVAAYVNNKGAHELTGDNTKTITLTWNSENEKWVAEDDAIPVTFPVQCTEELFPVNIVIYRNGDTSKAYKTVALESQPKGHVIDLTELKIADYYTANYTGKYDFCGWYNDGTWNVYKSDPANAPAGLEKITVNGWTNIIGMVYDYENVVYFRSAEDLSAYQNDHSKTEGLLYTTIARKGDALPTVDAPTAKRTGYTFKFWSREGQNGDVTGQTVGGWTNLYADWTPNSDTKYTVKYFFQNIADDQYTEDTELKEEPTGTTDTLATVTPRNFDGFTFNEGESTTNGTIAGDGSLVLALYYDRNAYTVTYTDGVDGKVFANDVHKDVKYEDATPAFNGTLTRTGYTFAGWDPEVADTVTGNVTYVAQWTADPIAVDLSQYVNKQYIRKYNRADTNATFTFEAEIASDALVVYAAAPRDLPVKLTGTVTLSTGETKNVAFTVNGTDSKTVSLNEGKYRITVKEVDSKNSYIDCDKSEYILYLDVYDDHTSGLTPVVTDISKNGELTCGDSVTFVNTYTRAYYSSVTTPSKPALNTGDHFAYVMGYPDGTVRPNGSITRAEVSTILFRLLSDKTRDEYFTTESSFTDVKAGAWYNNSIATLEKAGVIVDTAKGGAFRPDEAITRAELAAMLAQFADAKPVAGVKFTDVSADHWAYDAIAIAAKMGWIEGYPDGTFRPDATITRAEMMTLVNRALERVPSKEDHLLSERVMLTFPDCKSGDWFYIAVQEATNSHTYERAVTEKNGDEQWTALRANRDWTLLEK